MYIHVYVYCIFFLSENDSDWLIYHKDMQQLVKKEWKLEWSAFEIAGGNTWVLITVGIPFEIDI